MAEITFHDDDLVLRIRLARIAQVSISLVVAWSAPENRNHSFLRISLIR